MGRSRKQLVASIFLCVSVVLVGTDAAIAQRALIPSQAETSSALASKELDLPSVLVDRISRLVKSHPSFIDLKVEVRVGKVRQAPADCPTTPEITFASKSRPWGNFNVLIRCPQPFWAVTVPVQTRIFGPQVTAAKYLAQGTRLKSDDLLVVTSDITRTNVDMARDPMELVGKVLTKPVPQGAAVSLNNLREAAVIKVGEGVRVQVQGKGFQANGEGVALTSGAIGDSIRVRMPDGQQVQGQVVRAGTVEIVIQ